MHGALQAKRRPFQLSLEPFLCCQCLQQRPLQIYQQVLARELEVQELLAGMQPALVGTQAAHQTMPASH